MPLEPSWHILGNLSKGSGILFSGGIDFGCQWPHDQCLYVLSETKIILLPDILKHNWTLFGSVRTPDGFFQRRRLFLLLKGRRRHGLFFSQKPGNIFLPTRAFLTGHHYTHSSSGKVKALNPARGCSTFSFRARSIRRPISSSGTPSIRVLFLPGQ